MVTFVFRRRRSEIKAYGHKGPRCIRATHAYKERVLVLAPGAADTQESHIRKYSIRDGISIRWNRMSL